MRRAWLVVLDPCAVVHLSPLYPPPPRISCYNLLTQEGILHSSEEWGTHPKVIETAHDSKPFHKAFHPHLPYFHVWFEPNRGMGHIIEQGERWPEWFGREVLAGPLDLGPEVWRRPRPLSAGELQQARAAFAKQWAPYDWTVEA